MATPSNIKQWLKNAVWIALGLTIVIVLVAAMQKNKNAICKNIIVNIKDNQEQVFITDKNILEIMESKNIINKKAINEIDIKTLENKLEKNIWIENVDLYFDKNASLNIDVTERQPLCRIFKQNGNSFYIDNKNFILPLSNTYSAKVPVFSGFSNNNKFNNADSLSLESINKMALFLKQNEFWMNQIQQINIINNDEFELTPTIGNHTVLFGDTTNMDEKFKKLFKFYKTVSAKVGFDKYAVINVQYKNQIVTINKNENIAIDTAKANLAIRNLMRSINDSATNLIDTVTVTPIRSNRDTVTRRNNTLPRSPVRPTTNTTRTTNTITNNRGAPARATMPRRIAPPQRNTQQRSQQ